MKIVMLGPPGVGKGTQSKMLCAEFGIPQISTGDILRTGNENGIPLGKKAQQFMVRGELVPDDIMLGLIEETLFGDNPLEGFILDGFPRTIAQAEGLDNLFKEHDEELDSVILLETDRDTIVKRLSARRICRNCNAVYNLLTNPPKSAGLCDSCGGELYQRDDDRPETIVKRLEVYQKQTEPLVDFYRSSGKLRVVDGSGSADEIYQHVKTALGG